MPHVTYSTHYDDHPALIAVCLKCPYDDCKKRCDIWVKEYKRLVREEPDYNSGGYLKRGRRDGGVCQ